MKRFELVFLFAILAIANPSPHHNKFNTYQNTLIVGGRPAKQGETPYQLSLQEKKVHVCGASLVEINGTQYGITAAHCLFNSSEIQYYQVVAGDLNLNDTSGFEQTLNVNNFLVHENWSIWTAIDDIAIIVLNGTFELNDNVKTIPLPSSGQDTLQGNLTVSGWGRLANNGEKPSELQIVEIPLVNDTYCEQAYLENFYKFAEGMVCAGRTGGGASPCHGDSGGPAISDDGYFAGIVSWGYECGHPDYPAVFTKVSYFIDWIHATLQNNTKKMSNELHICIVNTRSN